jgi:G3E family GTPase
MPQPIPVTILGGYLGAGKTTLVNHLLRERGERRIAVLVNDFGELSIDDDLIESRDGGLLRLAGGCVCCSFGSDLMAALQQLGAMQPPPEHILIECSGVALPGAVARTLSLLPGLALDAVLVLADAETLRERATDRYVGDLVRQQLREADLVALNKVDRVEVAEIAYLQQWLAQELPRAHVMPCEQARLAPAMVLGQGVADHFGADNADPSACVTLKSPTMTSAATLFESLSLEFDHAVDLPRLVRALGEPNMHVLRAKGLMRDADGTPHVLQIVGARSMLARSAHARPRDGRLVCIGLRNALDTAAIRAALHACAVARHALRSEPRAP